MSINEIYLIYKSRRTYLKKLYEYICNMDFFSEKNRDAILEAIDEEVVRINKKINDLIW
jgi:hypothetical protein